MRYYELTCLISSELFPEELNSFQEKIISYVQGEKGILVKIDLSPKKRSDFKLFGLNFQLNPEGIEGLEKKLKADKQIIRYMILAKPPIIYKEVLTKPFITFRKKVAEGKVELKEIEKKLEEILGE